MEEVRRQKSEIRRQKTVVRRKKLPKLTPDYVEELRRAGRFFKLDGFFNRSFHIYKKQNNFVDKWG
jgi:hypothetical protein